MRILNEQNKRKAERNICYYKSTKINISFLSILYQINLIFSSQKLRY